MKKIREQKGNYILLLTIIIPFLCVAFMLYTSIYDIISFRDHIQASIDLSLRSAVNAAIIDSERQQRNALIDAGTVETAFIQTVSQNLKLNTNLEPVKGSRLESKLVITDFNIIEKPPIVNVTAQTSKKMKLWQNTYLSIPITIKVEVRNSRND